MYVGAGASKLRLATKTLRSKWDETEDSWRDSVRQDFERKRLDPIETHAHSTLRAMQTLCDVMSRIYRECS